MVLDRCSSCRNRVKFVEGLFGVVRWVTNSDSRVVCSAKNQWLSPSLYVKMYSMQVVLEHDTCMASIAITKPNIMLKLSLGQINQLCTRLRRPNNMAQILFLFSLVLNVICSSFTINKKKESSNPTSLAWMFPETTVWIKKPHSLWWPEGPNDTKNNKNSAELLLCQSCVLFCYLQQLQKLLE